MIAGDLYECVMQRNDYKEYIIIVGFHDFIGHPTNWDKQQKRLKVIWFANRRDSMALMNRFSTSDIYSESYIKECWRKIA